MTPDFSIADPLEPNKSLDICLFGARHSKNHSFSSATTVFTKIRFGNIIEIKQTALNLYQEQFLAVLFL